MSAIFMGAFLLARPLSGHADARLSDYAFCVSHNAIIAQRDKTKLVYTAVEAGFARCKAERMVARSAMLAVLASQNATRKETASKADRFMDENDRQLSAQLVTEISEYRRTGKIPTHA